MVEVVAQIEMGVTTRTGVHVDVHQRCVLLGSDCQPGLFARLSQGSLQRSLTSIDVAAGL